MRAALIPVAVCAVLASPGARAENASPLAFDVPAQPLAGALLEIARQGDADILASERITRGRKAPAIKGRMSVEQAVARALAGTGLGYRRARGGTIVIVPARASKANRKAHSSRAASPSPAAAVPRGPTRPAPPPPAPEIVVNAQRRAEYVQDIPLSVTVFDQAALDLAGVHNAMDLPQLDPSLLMSAQSGVVIPFLRGIGNPASSTPGNESSVPVYIDDVYVSRLYPAYLPLDHIDRVEILKGPQGTLFGRNATGGLIQIFTRDPGETLEFDGELGLSNYRTATGKAYLSAPLGDTLAASLAVTSRNQGEGWGRNVTTGKDAYYADHTSVRTKLVWKPSTDTQVRLNGFYVHENSSIGTVQGGTLKGLPRGLPPDYTEPLETPGGFYDIATNYDTARRHRSWSLALRVDHAFSFADASSITSYRHSNDPWTSEGDHTPYRWLQYALSAGDRQFSQEFQLKSKPGSKADWLLGLYYMDAQARIEPTTVTGEAIERGGFERIDLVARQTIVSRAAYAQATIPLGDGKTRATGGIRYTSDRVRGVGDQYATPLDGGDRVSIAPHIDDVSRFRRATFRLALDRQLTDDVMAYASYSRGFKSGTYNLIPLELPALNPEKVGAFEVGAKAVLAQGRVRLSLSAFRNTIRDPQVQVIRRVGEVAINQFVNAQRARSRGVEAYGTYEPVPDVQLRISGQWLDSRFLRFEGAPFNTPRFTPPFGVESVSGDASGNATPLSPRLKLNMGVTWQFHPKNFDLTVNADAAYRSSFKWEPDNRITEPALTLINASLTIKPHAMPHWSLRLWANNVTGEQYFSNVLTQSGPVGYMSSPAEPRTFGVAVRYKN
ncbi:hypothetical protein LK12_11045 [Novosphingobium malaysiense]|uniref:Secretin/TonB short N-terminal domain-containing protein n=1 Tax=Novosphingobium malaysiense TaxID=1348853 RepID=A0A0B1ZJT8_9SPHN|nr:hypothetical protein LK12_11045 [Novosphingobium malaysiense]